MQYKKTPYIQILITLPDIKLAQQVATELIKNHLAACIQMKPISSFYYWNNELCNSEEIEISLKSIDKHLNAIMDYINNISPYNTTQIIVIPIIDGDKDYLQWISNST